MHSFWRERDDRRGVRAGRGVGIDAAAREYAPPRGLWGWSRPSLSDVHLGMKVSSHRCVLCAPSKARVDFLVVTHGRAVVPIFPSPTHSASGWFPSALGRATVRRGRTLFPGGIVDPNNYSGNHRIRVCMDLQSSRTSEQSAKNPNFLLLKFRFNLGVKPSTHVRNSRMRHVFRVCDVVSLKSATKILNSNQALIKCNALASAPHSWYALTSKYSTKSRCLRLRLPTGCVSRPRAHRRMAVS